MYGCSARWLAGNNAANKAFHASNCTQENFNVLIIITYTRWQRCQLSQFDHPIRYMCPEETHFIQEIYAITICQLENKCGLEGSGNSALQFLENWRIIEEHSREKSVWEISTKHSVSHCSVAVQGELASIWREIPSSGPCHSFLLHQLRLTLCNSGHEHKQLHWPWNQVGEQMQALLMIPTYSHEARIIVEGTIGKWTSNLIFFFFIILIPCIKHCRDRWGSKVLAL